MTRKRKLVVAACVVLGLLVLVVAAFVLWLTVWFPYSLDQPMKYVAVHSNGNEAVFLQHGAMMGRRLSLFVRPNGRPDLIWVGTVEEDDTLGFAEAFWSADGTVIANRSAVTGYNAQAFVESKIQCPELLFTHAYDFSSRQPLVGPRDASMDHDECSAWVARSERIEKLLQERGGRVVCLPEGAFKAFNTRCAKVSYFEWKRLKRLEAAGLGKLISSTNQP